MLGLGFGGYLSALIIALIKFAYPTYASYKAIRSGSVADDAAWLVYWTIIGFESFVASYVIPFVAWLPFFMLARLLFYIWLQLPVFNGSLFIFQTCVKPFFQRSSTIIGIVTGEGSGEIHREEQKREVREAFHRILDSLH
jgi:receptor expression-enhancing protein 5/6